MKRYEGKAKIMEESKEAGKLSVSFKDDLTAFNNEKKSALVGKGALAAKISKILFEFLIAKGFQTHFIQEISPNVHEVWKLKMLPLEVIIRYKAAGSLAKRLKLTEGTLLSRPIIQFCLKDDSLGDPQLAESEVLALGLANSKNINELKNQTLLVGEYLKALFHELKLDLVDLKLEFGLDDTGKIILGDEISPDTMRLWRQEGPESEKKLDKDLFRFDLGDPIVGYRAVLEKLESFDCLSFNPKIALEASLSIHPQAGLLDPVGKAVTQACQQLGFGSVASIASGKRLLLSFSAYRFGLLEELCGRLLVSPAAEEYEYELSLPERTESLV